MRLAIRNDKDQEDIMRRGGNHRKVFKKKITSLMMAMFWGYGLLASGPVLAAPQGGVVTSGSAAISQSGNVTNINQATQKAAINWQSFSVKPVETVNFNQPNSSSITLNRVIGNERSVIEGALNANGKVFLVNSNGILFTRGSSVNTAGFLASTLNITDADFNSGNHVFKANGAGGSVINMGTINARDGGYVALLGNQVSNQGVITATKGTVALASGDKITLNFNGDSLLSVTVDEGTLNAMVENKEAIYADGGKVILIAKAADDLLSAQVNNSGLIQARTIDDLKGNISLYAQGGTTTVAGTLDASAPNGGDGGMIETSGNKVQVADSAYVTTKAAYGKDGAWLIDPDGYTIAASGGDLTGATLGTNLNNGNVTIASTSGTGTDGNINVNDAVTWSANTTLGLNASNNVNVNKAITATGDTAGLTLNAGNNININAPVSLTGTNAAMVMTYGGDYNILTKASYSGAVLNANGRPVAQTDPHDPANGGGVYGSITLRGSTASLSINGHAYELIHTMDQLAAKDDATGTASGYYALAENLDATTWSSSNTGTPSVITMLSGTFAGLGHTIKNLTLNAPSSQCVGLIGQTDPAGTAIIRDIGLENVDITAGSYAAALLGGSSGATISRAYSTGVINGDGGVGGLVGAVWEGATTVKDSYSAANISSPTGYAGGLIGDAEGTTIITNCHATGNVTSTGGSIYSTFWDVGGLIGYASNITVRNSYATGVVSAPYAQNVGGLIGVIDKWPGDTDNSSVTNSFATGNVTGYLAVGGLIGDVENGHDGQKNPTSMTVDNCYATGNVTARADGASAGGYGAYGAGGLIGYANFLDITNSYATGNVSATAVVRFEDMGGLVGVMQNGSITKSYATGDVIGNGGTVNWAMGGLVGNNVSSTITNSYATGDVTNGYFYAGGLVGSNSGAIHDSWASGAVSGHIAAGGLVGISTAGGDITGSRATGNVTGLDYTYRDQGTGGNWVTQESRGVGGLVGSLSVGSISNSTATGSVTGGDRVGGLVGSVEFGSISNSTASGKVTGAGDGVGGLVGHVSNFTSTGGNSSITDSSWDMDKTGHGNAIGTSSVDWGNSVTKGSGTTVMTDVQGTNPSPVQPPATKDDTRQAAFATEAAIRAGSTIGQALQYDTNPSREGGPAATLAGQHQSVSLDEHLVFAGSSSYSAHIKAISADGVQFELEDNDSNGRKEKE
jgi:filamentous hemagglutinin family protein